MAEAEKKKDAKKIMMNAVYMQAPGPKGTRGMGMNMSAKPAGNGEPARVAYGTGRQVWVRELENMSKSFYYNGHMGNVTGLRWHPRWDKGADWLCSVDDTGHWRVWTVRAEEPITQGVADAEGFNTGKELYDCCWEASGKKILVVGYGKEEKGRLADWQSGNQFGHTNQGANHKHLSCDASFEKPYRFLVGSESGQVYFYKVEGGMITSEGSSGVIAGRKYINIVRMHPSGNFAACGTGDGSHIYFIDAWTGKLITKWKWREESTSVFGLSWSESGDKLAVSGADKKVTTFSVKMPHELKDPKEGVCEFDLENFEMSVIGEYVCGDSYLANQTCCTFVGEDRVVSQSIDGDIVIVNEKCELINTVSGHYTTVVDVCCRDGKIYSCSGHKVTVMDPEKNSIRAYKGHHGEAVRGRPAAFSTMLLSAKGDTMIVVANNDTMSRTPVEDINISEPIKIGDACQWIVAGKTNNDLVINMTRDGLCSYMGLNKVSTIPFDCDSSPCADIYPDDSMLVMVELGEPGEKNHVRFYSISDSGELKFVEEKKLHGKMKGEVREIKLNPTDTNEACIVYGKDTNVIVTNLSTRKCMTKSSISPFRLGTVSAIKWRPGATSTIGVTGPDSKFALVRKDTNLTPWVVTREKQDLPHFNNVTCFDWMDDSSLATGDFDGAVHVWQFKKFKKSNPLKEFL